VVVGCRACSGGSRSVDVHEKLRVRKQRQERKGKGGGSGMGLGERIVWAPRGGGVNRCYSNFNSFSI
jgi:hypothetical protein